MGVSSGPDEERRVTEPKRESRLMIALVVIFAVSFLGSIAALLVADPTSGIAADIARILAPICIVAGVCMFLARILNL